MHSFNGIAVVILLMVLNVSNSLCTLSAPLIISIVLWTIAFCFAIAVNILCCALVLVSYFLYALNLLTVSSPVWPCLRCCPSTRYITKLQYLIILQNFWEFQTLKHHLLLLVTVTSHWWLLNCPRL